MTEVNKSTISTNYGTASLSPTDDVVAGIFGTWTVIYTVGALGMDDGSTLKIATNMSSDWSTPQFDEPTADNYASVETSGNATVEAHYDPTGHVRPFRDTVTIDVFDGSLGAGDTISVTFGDNNEGSLGHQVQTFPEEEFEFRILVDAFESGEFVRLPETLSFDIVAGDLSRLEAYAPTNASVGEPVTVSVRGEDFWGNTATFDGSLRFEGDETIDVPAIIPIQDGIAKFEVTFQNEGIHRGTVVVEERDIDTRINPVRVGLMDEQSTYWGDIHGQSGETVGTGTIQDYFEYLRDNAHLDFGSHAANDFQITDSFWETIQETVQEFNEPEQFTTFLCYEWSPNSPTGGDHNVYFKGETAEIHRSSSWQIADGYEKHQGTYPVSALYEQYEGRDDVLIIPHQGGRPARFDTFDPELTPFVEIASVWGVFEWFGQEALERGYDVGFVGGSDDHTGRPGASHPTNETDWSFPIKGPVMAAKAEALTRDALWDTFTNRCVYTTTGARLFLEMNLAGAKMGQEVTVEDPVELSVEVNATAPLESVDLFRGTELISSQSFCSGDHFIEFIWTGASSNDRHKLQNWNGGLTLSDGRLDEVEAIGFDHPTQGVTHRTDRVLRWDGATAGNYQGIRVTVDAPDDARLAFRTSPVSTSFTLGDLEDERIVDAGFLDRQVTIRRTGTSETLDAEVTFREQSVNEGRYPYYVRVRQTDGEMAWSSPIFVTIE